MGTVAQLEQEQEQEMDQRIELIESTAHHVARLAGAPPPTPGQDGGSTEPAAQGPAIEHLPHWIRM
jgi:hypothetical protein